LAAQRQDMPPLPAFFAPSRLRVRKKKPTASHGHRTFAPSARRRDLPQSGKTCRLFLPSSRLRAFA
ncbi:MAG TPA: hypothetical protein PLE35_00470, partial [Lentisphaeria bacterium]|nr:hypothetical protein [Lentisphaeria bacterium]